MKSIYIYIVIAIIIIAGAAFFLTQENGAGPEEAKMLPEADNIIVEPKDESPDTVASEPGDTEELEGTDVGMEFPTIDENGGEGDTSADAPPADTNGNDEDMVVCTADAKLCPNGSYVGRIGPDCEFAACPVADQSSTMRPLPPETSDQDVAPRVQAFNINGWNFDYSIKEIRVKKGDNVTINLTSIDGSHDWVVDEFGAQVERVQTGETASVTFVADSVGTYEYYCSVGNHRAMGMVGTLVVEE